MRIASSADEPMIIVSAADAGYSIPLSVMLFTCLSTISLGRDVAVYILDGGIRKADKDKITRIVEKLGQHISVSWLRPDMALVKDLKVDQYFSESAYLRLLIPDLLPISCKKALYLDCDLIVRRDVSALWQMDAEGYPVLAVQDYGIPYADPSLGAAHLGIQSFRQLGIPPDRSYFNSGVMVMNLEQWRANEIGMAAIEYVKAYDTAVRCHDQEALNVVLNGRWGEFDAEWNVMYLIYTVHSWPESEFRSRMIARQKELIDDPAIFHFAGQRKPWTFNGAHPARMWFHEALMEMVNC